MNRRHFALLTALTLTGATVTASAQEFEQTPPPDLATDWFAAVRFVAYDSDAEIRSIEVRVTHWSGEEEAGEMARSLTDNAETPLPEGEFYHSDIEAWLPDIDNKIDADGLSGRFWNTTVGVAAYQTFWAQVVVWEGAMVSVSLVSGAMPEPVQRMATSIMDATLNRQPEPCGPMTDVVPELKDVPVGMVREFRASEGGVWNDEGTPISDPWLGECSPIEMD